MILINNLGEFDSLAKVWEAYPYGGKEGDFVVVNGEKIGWDKYNLRWNSEGDAMSSGNQSEVEHIVAPNKDSAIYKATLFLTNIGSFTSLDEVWEAYPYGAKEGDFVEIEGKKIGWNKYSNNWESEADNVSAGNQPSITPPIAEQTPPTSYNILHFINSLGDYASLDEVWRDYPYGAKEGDYIVLNGVKVGWNKYTSSWGDDRDISAGNQPDVIPPIADPLPPASLEIDTLYNNLGEFDSLDEVWKAYPYGGKEGDFVVINNNEIAWNKYTKNWGDDTNNVSHPDISEEIDGDLLVKGDLHILGDVIATKLFESIPIDGVTIKWVSGKLQSEGLSLKEVEEFILGKKYITMDALAPYVTFTRLSNTLDDYAKIVSLNEYATKEWVLSLSPGGSGEIDTSEFVTLYATQTITGLKDFIYGLNVGGINISKTQDGVIFIDGNLVVRGGITQYGVDEVTSPTIMDAIIVDGVTISKEGGYLHFVGELGQAGINEEELASYLERNGYIDRDALSSEGFAKADTISTILQDYISKEVFNSSIASLTKDFVDKKSQQDIEGIKNFINGFTIGDEIKIYKTQDGVIYLDGNLVLKGSLTQYGNESTPAPNIFDGLPIDWDTIKRDANGVLYVDETALTTSGGLDETQLQAYLDRYQYITNDSLSQKGYATTISVSQALENYLPLNAFTKESIKSKLAIYDWALASSKPTYTASEVGALSDKGGEIQGSLYITDYLVVPKIVVNGKTLQYINGHWELQGDLIVSGAITQFASGDGYKASTIMDGVVVDNKTISKEGGVLCVIGGINEGLNESELATYLSNNGYITDSILLSKGYATSASVSASLASKANSSIVISAGVGLEGGGDLTSNRSFSLAKSGTSGTYTKVTTDAYGRVSSGTTLSASDIPNLAWSKITSGKPTTLSGYGITDAYTVAQVDDLLKQYMLLSTPQEVGAKHNFANGLKIGGIELRKTENGNIYLDGNLVLSGGVTMYGADGTPSASLFDALPIDGVTIKWVNGKLTAVGGGGDVNIEGITLEDVEAYLAENNYITQDALAPYATSNSVSALLGNYLPLSSFTKDTIKSTLGISDWALASSLEWSAINSKPTDINGYGMVEYLTNLNNATLNKFFRSSFQAGNRPAYNYAVGFTLGNTSISANYAAQLAIDYYGGVHTRYKASTEWSEWVELAPLSSVPTKLSQLTDDVVAGKYLPLSGGRLVYSGAQGLEAERTDGAPTHIMFRGVVNGTSRQLGGFGMNGYNDPVYVNPNGIRHKVLTAENYATYALPKDGTAAAATKLATPRTIWGQSFDGTNDIARDLFIPSAHSIILAHNDEGIYIGKDGVFWHNASNVWTANLMLFTSDKVGIGVTPTEKLEVGGNLKVDGTIKLGKYSKVLKYAQGEYIDQYGNLHLINNVLSHYWGVFGTDSKAILSIHGNGFVGIGTTTPSAKLDVNGSAKIGGDLTLNGGILSYTNGVWTLNGDLLVTGGVTQFAQGSTSASTIMDAIVVDGTTITKQNGKLVAIGGGGSASSIDWSGINNKPTTLAGYGIADAYTKNEVSEAITIEVVEKTRDFYTRSEAQEIFALKTSLDDKQNTLFSGVNIKTINGQSVLGEGNIEISGAGGGVVYVTLDVTKLTTNNTFNITASELSSIKMSRNGNAVIVKGTNNTTADSEWGQVVSCYRQYAGSSVYTYRVSILHKDNDPLSGADNAKLYNVDIMDSPSSSGYYCTVTSINNLY